MNREKSSSSPDPFTLQNKWMIPKKNILHPKIGTHFHNSLINAHFVTITIRSTSFKISFFIPFFTAYFTNLYPFQLSIDEEKER